MPSIHNIIVLFDGQNFQLHVYLLTVTKSLVSIPFQIES